MRLRFARSHVAVLVLLVVLLAGCSQSETDDAGSDEGGDASVTDAAFPASILDRGTLRVGLKVPNPPLQMITDDEQLTGVDIDLFEAMAEDAGLGVEFVKLDSASLVPALQSGRIDVTGVLLPSPDRLAVADFVIYFRVPFGVLVPKDNPHGIEGVSDMCGLTVALVQGQTPPENIVDDRSQSCVSDGEPEITKRLYPDNAAAYLSITSGQTDAFVQSEAVTSYLAKTVGDQETYASVADEEGLDGTVYFSDGFAVKKGQDDLLRAVQAALEKLQDDGRYTEILAEYGVEQNAVSTISINELAPEDATP